LERAFRARALGAGAIAGVLAVAGIFVVRADRHTLFTSLLTGRALGAVIVSLVAGVTTLVLVYRCRYEAARYSAALAVAAIVAGWALARWPTILPGLTIRQAAAGHATLLWLVVCVLCGALVLFPALALLFRLTLAGRFTRSGPMSPPRQPESVAAAGVGALARIALSCLIAGVALLNGADAGWAHAIGVVCLLGFVLAGFRAVVFTAMRDGLTHTAKQHQRT
jgi:cytochrome bd ubiquinol oxidase subunit II